MVSHFLYRSLLIGSDCKSGNVNSWVSSVSEGASFALPISGIDCLGLRFLVLRLAVGFEESRRTSSRYCAWIHDLRCLGRSRYSRRTNGGYLELSASPSVLWVDY